LGIGVLTVVLYLLLPPDIHLWSSGLQAIVFTLIGLIPLIRIRADVRKFERLKREGDPFEAEITALIPPKWTCSEPSKQAECIYVNKADQRCKVVSRAFVWSSQGSDELSATVYVDRNDPYQYAVEITTHNTQQVDIDYTRKR